MITSFAYFSQSYFPFVFEQAFPTTEDTEESHFPERFTELFLESVKLEVYGNIFPPFTACDEEGRLSYDAAAQLQENFSAVSLCSLVLKGGMSECPFWAKVKSVYLM